MRLFILAMVCGAFAGVCFEGTALQRGLDAFKRHDLRTAEREFGQAVIRKKADQIVQEFANNLSAAVAATA